MSSSQLSRPAAAAERALVALARAITPLLALALRLAAVRRPAHRRAVAAWESAPEPLVLCYGNINRSPFAVALAHGATPARPRSAGLYPGDGRPAAGLAVEEAKRRGVDLSGHRSALVTREQLRRAPAIFVFDAENVARLAVRSPAALARTHLFTSLAPDAPPFVGDPHGRPRREALDAFGQIAAVVDALAARRAEGPGGHDAGGLGGRGPGGHDDAGGRGPGGRGPGDAPPG